jgi:hypothetical protein
MNLQAGSDAKAVRWLPLVPETVKNLYASHCALVKATLSEMIGREHAGLTESDREIMKRLLELL